MTPKCNSSLSPVLASSDPASGCLSLRVAPPSSFGMAANPKRFSLSGPDSLLAALFFGSTGLTLHILSRLFCSSLSLTLASGRALHEARKKAFGTISDSESLLPS